VPNSNDCSNPAGTTCADDAFEDNDSRTQAATRPALEPDLYDMVSCEASGGGIGDDEDWFKIVLTGDALMTFEISGETVSDLDMGIYDSAGALIQSAANSSGSDETVSSCQPAGTYYLRVYAFGPEENQYLLDYTRTTQSCAALCQEDLNEPDDNASQATVLGYDDLYPSSYISLDNTLCTLDEDWFRITELIDGDKVIADLLFIQTTGSEDLDLHWYRNGVDLTGCSEATPGECTAAEGQSGTSDEHAEYTVDDATCTVSAPCIYYVVVHGWEGSENDYDLELLLEPAP
jgi:hypothetical protein